MANANQVKNQVATRQIRPMSPAVAEVRTNINLMVEVMKSCMVKDMHFGIIPGVQKPSLFKAGAEKLMATFRLSADPAVADLSANGEIRFRVKVEIKAKDGSFVGAGIGECSSGEEKFCWRAAVCQEEFDCTQEDKRRIKFKKDYHNANGFTKVAQVRCNPSDLANTILKMAKKRALVDGVLTATGASDLFSQDIEDLPEEYVASVANPVQTPHPEPVSPIENERTPQEPMDMPKEPSKADRPVKRLIEAEIGSTISEGEFLVHGVEFKDNIGKNGKSVIHCEDSQGQEYYVDKWGQIKEDLSGQICTLLLIKVGSWTDKKGDIKRGYMCDKVIPKSA